MKCSFIVLVMQLIFAGTVLSSSIASAQNLNEQISLKLRNANLREAFKAIEKQSNVQFNAKSELLENSKKKINLSDEHISIKEAIQNILDNTGLRYRLVEGYIVIESKPIAVKPGRISGKILDDKGESLPGASIRIIEMNKGIQSSADGSYQLSVEPGTYTIEVRYISFQTKRITEVAVKEDQLTKLDIVLNVATSALKEVVVTASYRKASIEGLYARQKNAAATTDGITSEQISRTPDNNVGQALTRISGLNVQENKFVTVRGLSDRYNNVMMNGSLLPSTEPNQRNFAFDVIPNGLVDNIVVYKTGTPDITGEFSGGVVEINTKDIPDENLLRFKIGSGSNSRATGKNFYQPKRGKHDFFAFDDGGRKLPSSYSPGSYAEAIAKGYHGGDAESKAAYGTVSAKFPNRFTMYKYNGMPVQDYEFNLGRVKQFKNDSRLGGVMALTYRNEQTAQGYIENLQDFFHYEGERYSFNTTIGGLMNMGYSFGKNKLTIKNVFSRKLNENAFIFGGKDLYTSNDIDGYANTVLIQTVLQNRLEGEHAIGDKGFKLNWHGGISLTQRDQPDNKSMYGEKHPGNDAYVYQYIYGSDNLSHISDFFGKLKEKRYSWSADAQQPFKALNQKQLLKFGYQGSYRTADFLSELFTILPENPAFINQSIGLPYNEVFAPENFGSGKLIYYPYLAKQGNFGGNGYSAFQRLNSFYGMLDGHILPKLRFTGGIRAEKNDMNTNTLLTVYERGTGNPITKDSLIRINKTDWLPSANLIYSVTSKFNIRGAYYHTVARPDFRELSNVQTYEPDKKTYIIGKDLKPTSIRNADLRLEFYPSPQELISVSGFYKKFKNPIELQVESSDYDASKNIFLTYSNLEEATDYGLEFNFRKSFDFLNSSEFFKNLYLSGNLTLINAKVKLQGGEDMVSDYALKDGTITKLIIPAQQNRPLYGQANYIINGGLLYTGKHLGFNAIYNRTGPKIVYGSEYLQYNEWEAARDVIDLQLSYRFLKQNKAEIKLNASDVLNQPITRYYNDFKIYQEILKGEGKPGADGFVRLPTNSDPEYDKNKDELRRKYILGRNLSLSFSYTF